MCLKPPKDPIEMTDEQAEALIAKVKKNELDKEAQQLLCQVIHMFMWLQFALRETKISLIKIKKLVFGQKSEKQKKDTSSHSSGRESANDEISSKDKPDSKTSGSQSGDKTQEDSTETEDTSVPPSHSGSGKKGNGGRLGFDAYTGAETIYCSHPDHNSGDLCPQCRLGSLFKMADPGREIRLFSQGLLQAIIYFLERYRCSACGAVFKTPMPD